MLDAFVRLRDADDVLRFARRFGVLRLCKHGLPISHEATCVQLTDGDGLPCAPIARWLHFARQAKAILAIAAAIHQGRPTDQADWRAVYEDCDEEAESSGRLAQLSSQTQRWFVEGRVQEWLDMSSVDPIFRWRVDQDPALLLTTGTFGLLGIQLATAITRGAGIALCSGCGNLYTRQGRRAQMGRRNYCPDCQASGVPDRDRKARWRSRNNDIKSGQVKAT
jgi:hypothetical protein